MKTEQSSTKIRDSQRPSMWSFEELIILARFSLNASLWKPSLEGAQFIQVVIVMGAIRRTNFPFCYLHHIGRKYWTLFKKHGFLDAARAEDASCQLATNYQLFREVIFALEKGGSFVLLSDNRNPTSHATSTAGNRRRMDFLSKFTPPELSGRVASVSIRDLATEIARTGRHEWVGQFNRKYGL